MTVVLVPAERAVKPRTRSPLRAWARDERATRDVLVEARLAGVPRLIERARRSHSETARRRRPWS